ncbi:MAG: PHP domain-containing protein [Dehalococcoidales bacterium]|nr:PHP domain-containing protein [Dehalococcoidales bacterium]
MKIDLHIHTSTGSDGALPVEDVVKEARRRNIGLMSITDHDSLEAQSQAVVLTAEYGISFVSGIELNVTFQPPAGKSVSLDFLGYGFDINNKNLREKLGLLREHREKRANEILKNINAEFAREGIAQFTGKDMQNIKNSVDGAFGRPHIAAYMVKKGIVGDTQEAFDRYLVKCDVPKYPLSLTEASKLIHDAGGILVLAHGNDSHGTSLATITKDIEKQTQIIQENMLEYIDGLECWHTRHDDKTVSHYLEFVRRHGLIATGGSDCHQKPIIMGTVNVPDTVAEQIKKKVRRK